MALLAVKLLLSPICVVAVSLAARRWGAAVAGVLAGLPVVAGPILLIETLEHGRGFGAGAAAGTLLGLVALAAFVLVYGRTARGAGPAASVLAGWATFLAAVAVLDQLHVPKTVALALAMASFAVGLRLLPASGPPAVPPARPPWWHLPAQALAALCLLLVLTGVSGTLGTHLSGLLAPFPVITSVLAVFMQLHSGRTHLELMLRNFLVGFYGFAGFCFVLAVTLPTLAVPVSFLAAIATAIGVEAAIFVLRAPRAGLAPSHRG